MLERASNGGGGGASLLDQSCSAHTISKRSIRWRWRRRLLKLSPFRLGFAGVCNSTSREVRYARQRTAKHVSPHRSASFNGATEEFFVELCSCRRERGSPEDTRLCRSLETL